MSVTWDIEEVEEFHRVVRRPDGKRKNTKFYRLRVNAEGMRLTVEVSAYAKPEEVDRAIAAKVNRIKGLKQGRGV